MRGRALQLVARLSGRSYATQTEMGIVSGLPVSWARQEERLLLPAAAARAPPWCCPP